MTNSPELPLREPNGHALPLGDVKTAEIADTINKATDDCSPHEPEDWEWWRDPSNEDAIITHQQLATAVYVANRGDICIRQEGVGGDYDICVFVRPENLLALYNAIGRYLGFNPVERGR
jgi:hypothetical protein